MCQCCIDSLTSTDDVLVVFGSVGMCLSCKVYDFVRNDVIVIVKSNCDLIL